MDKEILEQAIKMLQKVDVSELGNVSLNHDKYEDGTTRFTVDVVTKSEMITGESITDLEINTAKFLETLPKGNIDNPIAEPISDTLEF